MNANIHRTKSVANKVNSVIHRIKIYPVDKAIGFPNTYPVDSDFLSSGQRFQGLNNKRPSKLAFACMVSVSKMLLRISSEIM